MFKAVSGLPRGLAALVAVCLLCLPLIASADLLPQAGKDAASGAVAGQVLVTFRDTADPGAVARILRSYPPLSNTAGLYRLAAPMGAEAQTATQLLADPAVASASANPASQLITARPSSAARTDGAAAPAAKTRLASVNAASTDPSSGSDSATPSGPVTSPLGGTIRNFWLSDRQAGADPSQDSPLPLIGVCQGPRFNAGKSIWANIRYENMDSQVLRVQVYSLGAFKERLAQEMLGYGWSVSVSGFNVAANPLPNGNRLPPGCYEVRLYSSLDGNSSVPPLKTMRFQVVTTSPELQSSSSQLWHLDHSRAADGSAPPKRWVDIKASGAWNITTGGETTIAIVGYGVDINHPKLQGHIWTDPTDPKVHGWNFDTNSSDPQQILDDWGEGTFLAGLIAAEPDGGTSNGGLGVNWGAKIMPLRITRPVDPVTREWPQGLLDPANVISAVRWARQKHADVIFVSLFFKLGASGVVEQQFKDMLWQEIKLAKQQGIVVVAPVGDVDPSQPGDQPGDDIYPASFPETLTVSTTDQNDMWYDHAYRNLNVDVAAPGQTFMLSINNPNLPWLGQPPSVDPVFVQGDTTFSAALVTGVVGLIKSVNPYLPPDDIQNLLKSTAEKVDTETHSYDDLTTCSGWNEYLGCGRINAEKALLNTQHNLVGALNITPITATTPGQQCVRLENKRTGALTWKVAVPAEHQDWVTVTGPFSANSTDQVADYQGTLPSYAKVCVNLGGTGSGQRPYGLYMVPLTVSSTMAVTGPQVKVNLSVLYAASVHSVYLPRISQGVSTAGQ